MLGEPPSSSPSLLFSSVSTISSAAGCHRRDLPFIPLGRDLGAGQVIRSQILSALLRVTRYHASAYAYDARPAEGRLAVGARGGLGGR